MRKSNKVAFALIWSPFLRVAPLTSGFNKTGLRAAAACLHWPGPTTVALAFLAGVFSQPGDFCAANRVSLYRDESQLFATANGKRAAFKERGIKRGTRGKDCEGPADAEEISVGANRK